MPTFHSRTRTGARARSAVVVAAGAAALALSLSACGGGGTGVKSSGAGEAGETVSVSVSKAGKSGATPSASGTSGASGASGVSGASAASGARAKAGGAPSSSSRATAPVCTTNDVSLSAARHGGPPYTHLVLTAKNTSGHACELTGHPEIQFLESHREIVPPVAKSKPAAPVVLKAGAPAYALVRLSDGGRDESTEVVTDFSVTLQGGGGMSAVRAPGAGGVAVDPAKWATGYWTYELRNGADDF
ncbi:DUF4232 domain-containing protein [Streptomyces sp. NPDC005900]|uniref:DUF4232 domain-containing protein n=1 Tax=Streptomyces sp. NPDC005900 TaxID=3154569 RepID=UPI0033D461BE